MPDASPLRWHLAHTTWFFETFVLAGLPGYSPIHPEFEYLFNSYYNTVGEQFPRSRRGVLTRPTVREVFAYRHAIDEQVQSLLSNSDAAPDLAEVIELGLHHEQQHQELMLTDIKHAFSCNPLYPALRSNASGASSLKSSLASSLTGSPNESPTNSSNQAPLSWISYANGVQWIGHSGDGFAFDNESPRHREYLEPFALASRLVTNGEYQEFIDDGGYRRPEFWLSEGWSAVQSNGWTAPLYWLSGERRGEQFTLFGPRAILLDEPVCHVSYFEADAFARWRVARLPTEAEWETASAVAAMEGNFAEQDHPHPKAARLGDEDTPQQMFGDVWEWTSSAYSAYPGYAPTAGALGEYNGKFMCGQFVLRGGSCATPQSHIRRTYRNFFPPEARWQFSGIRLAR